MKPTTAKHLRNAKQRLGRDLAAKERRRALERLRAGQTLVRVEDRTFGGRRLVSLVWSDGPAECLPVKPTLLHLAPAPHSAVDPRPPVDRQSGPVESMAAPTPVRRAEWSGKPQASTSRSSARSGDSGEDGLGESAEPPSAGRLCECGCGQPITHRVGQARYLDGRHAAAERQRRKRERDRAPDESLADARALAREKRLNASRTGPCPGPTRAVGTCGAEFVTRDPEGGCWCLLCGTPRGPLTSPNGFGEFEA